MTSRALVILASFVLAALMVTAAFLFSGPSQSPELVSAYSVEEALKAYAEKDTDGDGLRDWEEALYDTDPTNPHSVAGTKNDREAVDSGAVKPITESTEKGPSVEEKIAALPGVNAPAGTVTGDFALKFFGEFIASLGPNPPTSDEITKFTTDKIARLYADKTIPDAFTFTNATASQSGEAALRAYAASIDALLTNPAYSEEKTEVDYFYDAVVKNNTTSLTMVAAIAENYDRFARAFVATPVPPEAQSAHVGIANAIARIGRGVADMSKINSDPLLGFIGIAEYRAGVQSLLEAYGEMGSVFASANVAIPRDTPGGIFYLALQDAIATIRP